MNVARRRQSTKAVSVMRLARHPPSHLRRDSTNRVPESSLGASAPIGALALLF